VQSTVTRPTCSPLPALPIATISRRQGQAVEESRQGREQYSDDSSGNQYHSPNGSYEIRRRARQEYVRRELEAPTEYEIECAIREVRGEEEEDRARDFRYSRLEAQIAVLQDRVALLEGIILHSEVSRVLPQSLF
jgi:hypothetical protein